MASTAELDTQSRALLGWYAAHRRDLPWRRTPSPYAVLVSELMLQQTRVETVRDYFMRWMARWPTLADLASAELPDVLAMWTGLGYYNRARNLHAAARQVVRQHAGELPQDAAALAALPGLGPYTVGAVLSIAYGQPAPLVDGNVARVLARWHALEQDPMQPAGRRQVWRLAADWLRTPAAHAQPGQWNQALMELGATVCTPRAPRCPACPVAEGCLARQQGRAASIPPVRQKAKSQLVRAAYAVVRVEGDAAAGVADVEPWVLLARRPEQVRWAGLWEPPGVEGDDCLQRLHQQLQRAGLHAQPVVGPLVHVLTHRRYEALAVPVVVHMAEVPSFSDLPYAEMRFMPVSQALGKERGLSRLAQKLLAAVV